MERDGTKMMHSYVTVPTNVVSNVQMNDNGDVLGIYDHMGLHRLSQTGGRWWTININGDAKGRELTQPEQAYLISQKKPYGTSKSDAH